MYRGTFSRSFLYVSIFCAISGQALANNALEEVVVTAQKQEENLQQVPISISAFSSEAIESRGISGVGDFVSAVPNMGGFESPDKRGSISVALRGVSSGSSNISFDPANAIYMDGVYLGKTMGSSLDVAEIERIEVLRGPQGTLYGRNSTGGAVNFITKRPTGEFHTKITGSVGNYNLRGLRANIDLPSVGTESEGLGTLAASVGAQLRQRDALYDNTNANHSDFDNLDRRAARLALLWQPRDNVTVDYTYDRSKLDEDQGLQQTVGLTPVSATGTSRIEALDGYIKAANAALNAHAGSLANAAASDPTFQRWYQSALITRAQLAGIGSEARPSRGSSDVDGFAKNESSGHSLAVSWNVDDLGAFGNVTFKSISGYRKVEQSALADIDGFDNSIDPATGAGMVNDSTLGSLYANYAKQASPTDAAANRKIAASVWRAIDMIGAGYQASSSNVDYSQWSEELQMVGATDHLDYVLGLYYFKDSGESRGLSYSSLPLAGVTAKNFDNETTAKAGFAQFTYRPAALDERLALTLGLRRTLEHKDITYLYRDSGRPTAPNGVAVFDGVPRPGTSAPYDSSFGKNFSNNSGMFNIAYQLTDDINVFAKYSTGYRSGGFNGDVYGNEFNEETIKQYELGMKSDWWSHRLRVNLALFQYTYDDQQVGQLSVSPSGTVGTTIVNGGQAKRSGGELEVTVAPIDDLLVSFNYGYIHGDFDKFATSCAARGCIDTGPLAKRQSSPGNQWSLVLDYTFLHLGFADLKGHLETYWQDQSYGVALTTGTYNNNTSSSTVVAYDPVTIDARTLVNARLTLDKIALPQGTLNVSLWGKNVFNQDYNTMGINFATLGPVTQAYGEPRTYGLDFTYQY